MVGTIRTWTGLSKTKPSAWSDLVNIFLTDKVGTHHAVLPEDNNTQRGPDLPASGLQSQWLLPSPGQQEHRVLLLRQSKLFFIKSQIELLRRKTIPRHTNESYLLGVLAVFCKFIRPYNCVFISIKSWIWKIKHCWHDRDRVKKLYKCPHRQYNN